MKITSFCELYGVSQNAIWVGKSQGSIPASVFIDTANIDETYFKRRWQYRRQIQLANQELVLFLEEFMPVIDIAKTVSKRYGGNVNSIYIYLQQHLFATHDMKGRPLSTQIGEIPQLVYKLFRVLDRLIRVTVGGSITDLLDKRCGL